MRACLTLIRYACLPTMNCGRWNVWDVIVLIHDHYLSIYFTMLCSAEKLTMTDCVISYIEVR